MKKVRTDLQREADAADCSLYRLASRLDGMAALYGKPDLRKAADIVASARTAIRNHMHADDRAVTYGEQPTAKQPPLPECPCGLIAQVAGAPCDRCGRQPAQGSGQHE